MPAFTSKRLLRNFDAMQPLSIVGRVNRWPLVYSEVVMHRMTTTLEPILGPVIRNVGKLSMRGPTKWLRWCLVTELTLVTVTVSKLVVTVIDRLRGPVRDTIWKPLGALSSTGPLAIEPSLALTRPRVRRNRLCVVLRIRGTE